MNNNPENNLMVSQELSIRDFFIKIRLLFAYIKDRILYVIFVALICSSLGYLYSYFFKKVMYTGTVTFVVDDGQGGSKLGGALGLASSLGFDLGGSNAGGVFTEANIFELLKSRRMVEKALLSNYNKTGRSLADQFMIIKKWNLKESLKKEHFTKGGFFFPMDQERFSFSRKQDSLLNMVYLNLKENLVTDQIDKKMSLLKISMTFEDESFAKSFLVTLVDVTSDFYIETKSKKSRQNLEIVERQVDSIRNELNSAIKGTAIATDNTYNLNPAMNINRIPVQKRQIDIQANMAILTELVKNLEVARLTLRKETPLFQIIDSPIMPLKIIGQKKITNTIIGFLSGAILTIIFFLCKRYLVIIAPNEN